MKFGSLFAGIGGFDLGLERAGMSCAWQVEIDDYATRVLEKHWPNVRRYKDVRECGSHNLEPVDLICGGFPCQPHSVAGKRRGAEDDRDLWPEYLRIITELRPRWVVGENVPGLRTSPIEQIVSKVGNRTNTRTNTHDIYEALYTRQAQMYLASICKDLEQEGYTVIVLNLPAVAFDAPHRRKRLWIIGYTERSRRNREPRRWSGTEFKNRYSRMEENPNPHANSNDRSTDQRTDAAGDNRRNVTSRMGETVPDADRRQQRRREQPRRRQDKRDAIAPGHGAQRDVGSTWWTVEPDVGRVAHGVPARVDRLRCLGNAVVPQVVEWIGNIIMESDNAPPR